MRSGTSMRAAAFVDESGDHFEGWLRTVDEQQRATDNAPLLLWIEEAAFPLGRHQRLDSLVGRLLRTRRHRSLSWILTTQSPKDGPLQARELLDRVVSLRVSHPDALDSLGRLGLRDHLADVRALPIGESIETRADGTIERHRKVKQV